MARSQKEADYSFQLATHGVSCIDGLCEDCLGCGITTGNMRKTNVTLTH